MLRTSQHGGDALWAAVLQTESAPCQGGPWAGTKFTITTAAAHTGAVGRHHKVIYLSTNPLGINPHKPWSLRCSHLPSAWCAGPLGPQALPYSGRGCLSRLLWHMGPHAPSRMASMQCSIHGTLGFCNHSSHLEPNLTNEVRAGQEMPLRGTGKV